MSRSEYMKKAHEALTDNRISDETYWQMVMNADIFCDDEEDRDERFPAAYAEVDYGDRIWYDAEAIEGARFDDMNYTRYFER